MECELLKLRLLSILNIIM